jgi:SecD/SecF fusion protein
MRHRRWFFALSGTIIAIGLISLFVKGDGHPLRGLNFGLEFEEGTRITATFESSPGLAEVREVLAAEGYGEAPSSRPTCGRRSTRPSAWPAGT